MVMKLYMTNSSPPVRAVLLTAEALGIKLEHVIVNIMALEHLDPKFLEINPQHSVPVLDDNGTIIWDSHAINAYLVTKYGKDDSLYPKDSFKRAVIDQRLHFDSCNLFGVLRIIAHLMVFKGYKIIPDYLVEEMDDGYKTLNEFLKDGDWAAGDDLSLADFSLISTVTSSDLFVPVDTEKYENIERWIHKIKELPYYHVNQHGLHAFKRIISSTHAKQRKYSFFEMLATTT
ncbi:hypothetical protein RN001_012876 [Aquatica leii]|uniref:Glutathione transferase n=1 Tax=Aquatica leii TaxID=1421715 RepID=A0AAN7PTA0_9COLE|nr:hypothetical protein RN001_012876 [Aquatica leii]